VSTTLPAVRGPGSNQYSDKPPATRPDAPPAAGGVAAAGAQASAQPFATSTPSAADPHLQADATDQMDRIGVADRDVRNAVQARVVRDGDTYETNTAVLVRDEINRLYDQHAAAGTTPTCDPHSGYDPCGYDRGGNTRPTKLLDDRGHDTGATVREHRNPDTGRHTTHIDLAPAEFHAQQGPYGNGPTSDEVPHEVSGSIEIVHPDDPSSFDYQVKVTDGAGLHAPQTTIEPHEEETFDGFLHQQVERAYTDLADTPQGHW